MSSNQLNPKQIFNFSEVRDNFHKYAVFYKKNNEPIVVNRETLDILKNEEEIIKGLFSHLWYNSVLYSQIRNIQGEVTEHDYNLVFSKNSEVVYKLIMKLAYKQKRLNFPVNPSIVMEDIDDSPLLYKYKRDIVKGLFCKRENKDILERWVEYKIALKKKNLQDNKKKLLRKID